MSKMIRRTIIVTIIETWTIVWPDERRYDEASKGEIMTSTRISRKTSVVETPVATGAPQIMDISQSAQFVNQMEQAHQQGGGNENRRA
ncbi:MAG: hypothetical protein NT075_14315 [Chloroflexi bacterium]|nr:hypothetical protein [Chloroflexota bacterium]